MAVRYGIDEKRSEQDSNEIRHQLKVERCTSTPNPWNALLTANERYIEFFLICYHLHFLPMVQAYELKTLQNQLLIGIGS